MANKANKRLILSEYSCQKNDCKYSTERTFWFVLSFVKSFCHNNKQVLKQTETEQRQAIPTYQKSNFSQSQNRVRNQLNKKLSTVCQLPYELSTITFPIQKLT